MHPSENDLLQFLWFIMYEMFANNLHINTDIAQTIHSLEIELLLT